jgi:hypothetical protein
MTYRKKTTAPRACTSFLHSLLIFSLDNVIIIIFIIIIINDTGGKQWEKLSDC